MGMAFSGAHCTYDYAAPCPRTVSGVLVAAVALFKETRYRYQPLAQRVHGQIEKLQGRGAQERRSVWRSEDDQGGPLPAVQAEPRLANLVLHNALIGKLEGDALHGHHAQVREGVPGQEGVRSPGVYQGVKLYRAPARRVTDEEWNGECAHERLLWAF